MIRLTPITFLLGCSSAPQHIPTPPRVAVPVGSVESPHIATPALRVDNPGTRCLFGGTLAAVGAPGNAGFIAHGTCDLDDEADGIAVFRSDEASLRWLEDSGSIQRPIPRAVPGGRLLTGQAGEIRLWADVLDSSSFDLLHFSELPGEISAIVPSHDGFVADLRSETWFIEPPSAYRTFHADPHAIVNEIYQITHPDQTPGLGIKVLDVEAQRYGVAWLDETVDLNEPIIDRVVWQMSGTNQHQPVAAGDLDGDGRTDLVVGSRLEGPSTLDRVDVFFDASHGRPQDEADVTIRAYGSISKSSVVGDFDGDGFSDLAVANPRNANGYVMIFRGPLSPGEYDTDDADLIFSIDANTRRLGFRMAAADVDDDGIDELAASQWDENVEGQSFVYVFDDVLEPWIAANSP